MRLSLYNMESRLTDLEELIESLEELLMSMPAGVSGGLI